VHLVSSKETWIDSLVQCRVARSIVAAAEADLVETSVPGLSGSIAFTNDCSVSQMQSRLFRLPRRILSAPSQWQSEQQSTSAGQLQVRR